MKTLTVTLFMALIAILLSWQACSANEKSNVTLVKYKVENIEMNFPLGVSVSEETPVDDFTICTYHYKGNVIMKAYIGNNPSFPNNKLLRNKGIKTTINTFSAETISWQEGNNFNREILINLRKKGWPMFIHFYYLKQTSSMAIIDDRIIDSVQYKPN